MPKCPNCGSTAQVKLTKQYFSFVLQAACMHYVCGCGCTFETKVWEDGTVSGRWQTKKKGE